ncbi:MAG: hypothetical protein Q7K55_00360 [Candidatus Levybacteria bacterium]|nr:hypothetical protein [Candidatus Levybacteria bacterium]
MKKQSLTKLIMLVLILFVFNIIIPSDTWAQEATPTATLTPTQTITPVPTSAPTSVPTSTLTPTSEPSSSNSNQTTASPTKTPTSTPGAKVGGDKKAVLGSSTKLGKTSSAKEIAKWGIASAMGILVFLAGLKIRKIHVEE